MNRTGIFYEASVTDNADPDYLGRLRLRSDHAFGGGESAFWVPPYLGTIFPLLPGIGDQVRLMFEAGDPERQWWLPMPPTMRRPCPAILQRFYPKIGWLRTAAGSTIAISEHGGFGGPFIWLKNVNSRGMIARGDSVFIGGAGDPELIVQDATHLPAAYMAGGNAVASTTVFISP